MYFPASRACDMPNSTTPLTTAQIAASQARMAQYQNQFNTNNQTFNDFVLALGGNPFGSTSGDAGVPTTGAPWSWAAVDRRGRPGAGNVQRTGLPAELLDTRARETNCTVPTGQPLMGAFYVRPPVVFLAPPRPPQAALPKPPAKSGSAPVCVTKSLPAAGMLPARTWQECTIDGSYSCGWNEYMESVNYDQPWPSAEAKAQAAAKYAKCLAGGRGGMYGPGMSGLFTDQPGASALWGSLALAGFAMWAASKLDKGKR